MRIANFWFGQCIAFGAALVVAWMMIAPGEAIGSTDAVEKDVKMVMDKIRSDPKALKKYCGSNMGEMRVQITEFITALARSGKLQSGEYNKVGETAGPALARSCY